MEDQCEISIRKLEVSGRIKSVFKKYHFGTINELLEYTGGDFTVLHNIGKNGQIEIEQELLRLGVGRLEDTKGCLAEVPFPKEIKCKLSDWGIKSIYELEGESFRSICDLCSYKQNLINMVLKTLEMYDILITKEEYTLIESVGLSVRTQNLLKRNHIYFLEQLQKYSMKEMKEFRGMGEKMIRELEECLKSSKI